MRASTVAWQRRITFLTGAEEVNVAFQINDFTAQVFWRSDALQHWQLPAFENSQKSHVKINNSLSFDQQWYPAIHHDSELEDIWYTHLMAQHHHQFSCSQAAPLNYVTGGIKLVTKLWPKQILH